MEDDSIDRAVRSADLLAHTTQIVAAHVGHNAVSPADVPVLIKSVHEALTSVGEAQVEEAPPEPAVPIRRSLHPDYLICLEDGRKLKMLRRHLRTAYNMSPEEYRAKWGLPADYPMVAPNYAKQRSELAKRIGLGRRRAEPENTKTTKQRSSRKKASAA